MFLLNNRPCKWEEGLTVRKLLEKNKFTYPLIVVIINGENILDSEYSSRLIRVGDDVKVIHLAAGG